MTRDKLVLVEEELAKGNLDVTLKIPDDPNEISKTLREISLKYYHWGRILEWLKKELEDKDTEFDLWFVKAVGKVRDELTKEEIKGVTETMIKSKAMIDNEEEYLERTRELNELKRYKGLLEKVTNALLMQKDLSISILSWHKSREV